MRQKIKERWVIKAGSQMICEGGPVLLRAWMQQVAVMRRQHGIEVVWVTSGAIASAVDRTGFARTRRNVSEKQALSAIGQPIVMDLYNLCLQSVGLLGAQVLLTYDDFKNKTRCRNLQNTLEQLLEWNVTPILNENDAISTEEIKFGDNDTLSAKVAGLLKADRLVILTDVEGLYDRDPKSHKDARLISRIDEITPSLLKLVGSGKAAVSARGTGGMYSKLRAANEALKSGIATTLVKGDHPQVLARLAKGEVIGTLVQPKSKKARK